MKLVNWLVIEIWTLKHWDPEFESHSGYSCLPVPVLSCVGRGLAMAWSSFQESYRLSVRFKFHNYVIQKWRRPGSLIRHGRIRNIRSMKRQGKETVKTDRHTGVGSIYMCKAQQSNVFMRLLPSRAYKRATRAVCCVIEALTSGSEVCRESRRLPAVLTMTSVKLNNNRDFPVLGVGTLFVS
jgi:hypothetical protein